MSILLSEAEWKVMNVVWDWPVEISVRDVHEQLEEETNWAYQTVQTVMGRLLKKGAVKARLRANTKLYTAIINRSQARRTSLSALARRAFDGTFGSMIQTMVVEEYLTTAERNRLRILLDSEKKGRKKSIND